MRFMLFLLLSTFVSVSALGSTSICGKFFNANSIIDEITEFPETVRILTAKSIYPEFYREKNTNHLAIVIKVPESVSIREVEEDLRPRLNLVEREAVVVPTSRFSILTLVDSVADKFVPEMIQWTPSFVWPSLSAAAYANLFNHPFYFDNPANGLVNPTIFVAGTAASLVWARAVYLAVRIAYDFGGRTRSGDWEIKSRRYFRDAELKALIEKETSRALKSLLLNADIGTAPVIYIQSGYGLPNAIAHLDRRYERTTLTDYVQTKLRNTFVPQNVAAAAREIDAMISSQLADVR